MLLAQRFNFSGESLRGLGSGEDGLLFLGDLDARFQIGQLGFELRNALLKLLQLDGVQPLGGGFGRRDDGCIFAAGFLPAFPIR